MAVSREEVRKIADLANLRFETGELERFQEQFQSILDYVTQLESVATEGVDPTYHALAEEKAVTPMRADAPEPSLCREEVLENAPRQVDGQFQVPGVLEP